MTQIHANHVRTALLAKGFFSHHTDHEWFVLKVAGKTAPIRTKLSHGERTVDDWLIQRMAKQLRLTKREFLDLIQCKLSGSAYVDMLKDRGQL